MGCAFGLTHLRGSIACQALMHRVIEEVFLFCGFVDEKECSRSCSVGFWAPFVGFIRCMAMMHRANEQVLSPVVVRMGCV